MIRSYARWQDVVPGDLRGHCAVVIDVLRWSTVVVTALHNGADAIEAYATPEEVRIRAADFDPMRVLLGGERGNVALPGFDVGNSPQEYGHGRVLGRTVLTTTTNGTNGLLAAREAASVLVGAFVNLDALAIALTAESRRGLPIALIACGQAGEPADEDLACAGAIATRLGAAVTDVPTDRACALWARTGRDAAKAVAEAPHAASLRDAGFGEDLAFAARVGALPCVPRAVAPHRLLAATGLAAG